jgi:hypothetical protein
LIEEAAMSSRRIIEGVLHNFLGTFTSRYSDFDGYWVFGFLVKDMESLRIDLLGAIAVDATATPLAFARQLAAQKFTEQITKAGLPRSRFQEAHLEITKSPHKRLGTINGWRSSGYDFRFGARAITDLGKEYDSVATIFVAPHDPKVEGRSSRAV